MRITDKEGKFSLRKTNVYKATNLINGKIYIGITAKSIYTRSSDHWYEANKGSNVYFHNALRKYGRDVFRFSCLKICNTYAEALSEEVRLIALLKPDYNCTPGGEGTVGKKMSDYVKQKLREVNVGRPSSWKGKKREPNIGEAVSKRNKMPDRLETWQHIKTLGPKSIQRPVICLNDEKEYESIRAAAKFYGVHDMSINHSCKKKMSRAGGLLFRYVGDNIDRNDIQKAEDIYRENKIKGAARAREAKKNCVSAFKI